MKASTSMIDRQCGHAESRMRYYPNSGGIQEGEKIVGSAEKCSNAS